MKILDTFKFGDPDLHTVSTANKYEVHGVAFLNDEKAIGFFFDRCLYFYDKVRLSLAIESSNNSKSLYDFFKRIFITSSAPMSKYWGSLGSDLHIELEFKQENTDVVFRNIEKEMSTEWRKAFDTFFSANKK